MIKNFIIRVVHNYIKRTKARLAGSGLRSQRDARETLNSQHGNNILQIHTKSGHKGVLPETFKLATGNAIDQIDNLPFYHKFLYRKAVKWYAKNAGDFDVSKN